MSDPPSSLVIFRRVPAGIPRAGLQQFASSLRDEVADGRDFECLITNDRELQRLNRQFRGKNEPTDVLSFPAAEMPAGDAALGELAVSWQRASAQATEYGHSLDAELRVLMLHGVLHLLGMDHETDRGRMARAETRWRSHFQLPGGLIERARQ
jgi:probable rRNA maturation factor